LYNSILYINFIIIGTVIVAFTKIYEEKSMKTKLNKKLVLNKETVANVEMKNIYGGGNSDDGVCPTWFYTCDQETCQGQTC